MSVCMCVCMCVDTFLTVCVCVCVVHVCLCMKAPWGGGLRIPNAWEEPNSQSIQQSTWDFCISAFF